MDLTVISFLLLICFSSISALPKGASPFKIGTGIYDITGPVAEVRFFGYADLAQTGEGLHLRQRARAYDIIDQQTSEKNRVLLIVTDLWAINYEIKATVLEKLEELYPGEYRDDNVMIGCTHTHSGPGGYANNFLFNLPALGFNQQCFDAVINGIMESIVRARGNQREGRIYVNKGNLEGLQVNRSPPPYANNPEEERKKYGSDVDKEATVLKFVAEDGTELGMIAFHAVHAVSMKMVNRLVSSDNKGYAAQLFEKFKGTKYSEKFGFAASFPIANAGDISPNTGGVIPETGELIGEGGEDYFESTRISATRMFEQTKDIYDQAVEEVTGPIMTRSTNVDMSNVFVEKVNKTTVPAALGYSFTAGTADGIAFGMQYQGLTKVVPALERISKILADYDDDFQEKHNPKPILVPAGITKPAPMVPQILNIQLIRLGQVAIIGLPSEITTMAGRRLKETILSELSPVGVRYAGISALTNGYSQYCVTKEEYDIQWYEGATTYFGPYTLMAYQQEYAKLAASIIKGVPVPAGPAIKENPVREILPEHRFDESVDGYDFGDVMEDVEEIYRRGLDVVQVTFAGANPRSNLRTQDTFISVEYFNPSTSQWLRVADDSNWETKLHWIKNGRSQSIIRVEWQIPSDSTRGTYRIVYFGDEKSRLTGRITPFKGISKSFNVE